MHAPAGRHDGSSRSTSSRRGRRPKWASTAAWHGQAIAPSQNVLGNVNLAAGDDVWVAQGTYKPSVIYPSGADSGRKTFHIPKDIGVYGGFLGTEIDRTERNPEANETILDGDFDQTITNRDSYHVVYFDAADHTTTKLSGFTIRNGRADHLTDPTDSYGGGILMKRTSPISTSGPSLDRLKIQNNTPRLGGGGLYCADGQTWVANCRFGVQPSDPGKHRPGRCGAGAEQGAGHAHELRLLLQRVCGRRGRHRGKQ